jgi:hypothetical protein
MSDAAALTSMTSNAVGRRPSPRGSRCLPLVVLATAVLAAFGGAASFAADAPPCGTSTLATVETTDLSVANSIYGGELSSGEVVIDAGHITSSAALLQAVAHDNRAATFRAVQTLVYHPHWHIVRLRVLDTAGRVLADFGGPYVIAPVAGVLRVGTRVVGSYVMSVQDDHGFTLLETRFVGDPTGIYYHGVLVAETGARFPVTAPSGPTMGWAGVTYAVTTRTYDAFPTGTLTAVILLPPLEPSLSTQPCAAVHAAEVARIAEHLAALFHPLNARYRAYAGTVHSYTGAKVIVRIGLRAIPGSEGLGPPVIPTSGTVSYQGTAYFVFSFAPTPPARIYLLIAQATLTGVTGPTGATANNGPTGAAGATGAALAFRG